MNVAENDLAPPSPLEATPGMPSDSGCNQFQSYALERGVLGVTALGALARHLSFGERLHHLEPPTLLRVR